MSNLRVFGAAMVAVALLAGQAFANSRHVPTTYPTIAAALAASQAGDRIVVAPGVYHEHDLALRSGVVLIGSPSSPGSVVIDAGGAGRVMRAEGLALAANVIGVTLTGGHADGANAHDQSGGGLFVDRATVHLQDVIVADNAAAGNGGGVRVTAGSLTITRGVLRDNAAGRGGGGLEASYQAQCQISETTIVANTAAWGGAVAARVGSQVQIVDAALRHNRALDGTGLGGAAAGDLGASLTLLRCLVADNEARYGGGVYTATGADTRVVSATVDRNVGVVAGGGLYCKLSSPTVARSIVSFNTSAAVAACSVSQPVFSGCDVYGNSGGDWTGPLANQLGVDNNFSADPLFCGPDDRGLQADSPCLAASNGFGLVGAFPEGCRTTDVAPDLAPVASLAARPNPFNPMTEVVFTMPTAGRARLDVVDLAGRRVSPLVDGDLAAGEHRVRWEARDVYGRPLSSGVYVLVLNAAGRQVTSKVMLAR